MHRYVHTFEGLAEEGEGGLLVADGGAVDEGLDGGFGVARGVSFEYASQHLRGLSSSEVRRTIRFAAAAAGRRRRSCCCCGGLQMIPTRHGF